MPSTDTWRGPDWFEPRLPTSVECSIGRVLESRAARAAAEPLAVLEDGRAISNSDAFAASTQLAAALAARGVARGDMVALWQPNGRQMVAAIFACSMLGAVAVQINIAFRGAMLAHALALSGARVMFAHGELAPRLADVDRGALEVVLSTEVFDRPIAGLTLETVVPWGVGPAPIEIQVLQPWDLSAIIFTSGTTGPSKGVRVTCCQLWSLGRAFYGFMTPADRMLLVLPLFHIASLGALWGSLSANASVAIMEAFRTADFWEVVRRTGATTNMGFADAFMNLLLKAKPSRGDRDHGLRRMLVTSVNPTVRAFADRFGVEVFAGYSMSETSVIAISQVNPTKNRSVGRPRRGIQARLVDEHDREVPVGTPGELVVRAELPWVLNDGYQNAAEATVRAWRNGWFHTGDLLVADADGDLYYVDRLKDAIRRRGENISSAEVEAEVRAFAAVQDAAAVGVVTPEGEELLIAVTAREGHTVQPVELVEFLAARMPHFMVPRFVRVLDHLPLTQTNKVQKTELRAQGVTADAWDREAAGMTLRRQRLATD